MAGTTILVHNSVTTGADRSVISMNGNALTGTVQVGREFEGTINAGSIASTGRVEIARSVVQDEGEINVTGDMDGDIEIGRCLDGPITLVTISRAM